MPNTIEYKGNLVAASQRGPSATIWADCPALEILEDPSRGMYFFDDFIMAGQPTLNAASSMGQWACFADTGSTFVDAGAEGGILQLLNTTTGKQITLSSNSGAFRLVSGATTFPLIRKMWFECRIAKGSISSGVGDMFVGLCDNTTTQICSAANLVVSTAGNALITTPNLLGFHMRSTTNPTDVGLAFNVAGGTVQYPTNLQTLSLTVAGAALTAYAAVTNGAPTGFIKLGFLYDPSAFVALISSASSGQTAGTAFKKLLRVFVNGLEAPAFLDTTNLQASTFPTGWMAPVVAIGAKSSSPAWYIDWIRVAQLSSY